MVKTIVTAVRPSLRRPQNRSICSTKSRRRGLTVGSGRRPGGAIAVLRRPGRPRQPAAFQTFLAALRKVEWVVYAKRPFGGPDAVLAYLSRYTHRTAIANSRLVAFAGERVTFKWKDYRAKGDARYKLMTLDANEFIRRFLIHVLPTDFIASVTTASSPMPTGPTTLPWPAGSSPYPTQLRRAGRAITPKMVAMTKTGMLALAAAGG